MGPCLHSLHSLPFWPPDQSPGSSHSRPGCGHAGPEGKGKDQPRGSYRTGRRRGDGERHLHQDAPAPRKDIGPRRKLPGAPRQTEGGSEVLREVGPRELKLREAGKPASCPQAPGRPGGHATRQSNERHTSDKGPAGGDRGAAVSECGFHACPSTSVEASSGPRCHSEAGTVTVRRSRSSSQEPRPWDPQGAREQPAGQGHHVLRGQRGEPPSPAGQVPARTGGRVPKR